MCVTALGAIKRGITAESERVAVDDAKLEARRERVEGRLQRLERERDAQIERKVGDHRSQPVPIITYAPT